MVSNRQEDNYFVEKTLIPNSDLAPIRHCVNVSDRNPGQTERPL